VSARERWMSAASDAERADLQAYLDKHELQPRLNQLLNDLVHETPAKPFEWMADNLMPPVPPGPTIPVAEAAAHDPSIAGLPVKWDAALIFRGDASTVAAEAASTEARADAGETGGDKEAKKAAKAEEKRKKEEEKERKRKEREEAERKNLEGPEVPTVTLLDFMEHPFGQLTINSNTKTERTWTDVDALTPALSGSSVWLRARLHNTRKQSAKLGFIELRQRLSTVQVVVQGKDLVSFACGLPKESIVDVLAEVTTPPAPITSCTQSGVELQVTRIYCISKAATRLPLQLEDAGRSDAEVARLKLPRVEPDTRLDNRVIDLRTSANQGIFRIQSEVCALFREFLLGKGFIEIHSPKMIATASEGGADVFKLTYFQRHAYLAQSPQLYKQMALMGDLGRPGVFEIGPVFRSEKSFTHRHMTEFTGLDMEMTFKDDYHEVLEVLEGLFIHIFAGLNERCAKELEAVRAQYPFEDLKFGRTALRLTYYEAVQLLREHGPAIGAERLAALEQQQKAAEELGSSQEAKDLAKLVSDMREHLKTVPVHGDEEDLSTRDEKLLGAVVSRVKDTDFYVIDKFPAALRPFYTMPDPDQPNWANAYDIFIRGEEVTSGAQRIHDPEMLVKLAAQKGVDLTPIQDYVNSFNYGAFPHAGGGIGMERVVMLFLGLDNIRKSSMFPRDPTRLTP
jgi:aspartyl-tRNA synthetase